MFSSRYQISFLKLVIELHNTLILLSFLFSNRLFEIQVCLYTNKSTLKLISNLTIYFIHAFFSMWGSTINYYFKEYRVVAYLSLNTKENTTTLSLFWFSLSSSNVIFIVEDVLFCCGFWIGKNTKMVALHFIENTKSTRKLTEVLIHS